jgi:hypothetical protein
MKNSLRGFYFATHFYNFYHAAPIEEVYDRIVDLALRGCNCLMLCFGVQHYTGMDTPEAVTFVARMKQMLKFADQCGMAPALILFSNTGFADSYHGIEAQCEVDDSGRYIRNNVAEFNTEICPNAEGGMEEIERKFVYLLQTYHFETVCPDQDYLNVLCRDKVLYLDRGWNKMSIDCNYSGTPNLVHYNMFYKPWQYKNIVYQEYFWQYAEMTAFYDELHETQRNFGLKNKLAHIKANRVLHRNALRICALPDNFNRVLNGGCPGAAQMCFEVPHEA